MSYTFIFYENLIISLGMVWKFLMLWSIAYSFISVLSLTQIYNNTNVSQLIILTKAQTSSSTLLQYYHSLIIVIVACDCEWLCRCDDMRSWLCILFMQAHKLKSVKIFKSLDVLSEKELSKCFIWIRKLIQKAFNWDFQRHFNKKKLASKKLFNYKHNKTRTTTSISSEAIWNFKKYVSTSEN